MLQNRSFQSGQLTSRRLLRWSLLPRPRARPGRERRRVRRVADSASPLQAPLLRVRRVADSAVLRQALLLVHVAVTVTETMSACRRPFLALCCTLQHLVAPPPRRGQRQSAPRCLKR